MIEIKDLIEDWIEIRAILLRQISALKECDVQGGGKAIAQSEAEKTVVRLTLMLKEMNALLKEFSTTKGV